MDKAIAAVATVRNAILDTVNMLCLPAGGRIHLSTLKMHIGGLRVRKDDYTDALSSLVDQGVFTTHIDGDGLLLQLTEMGADVVYAPPSLVRPMDWIAAFRTLKAQREFLRRPAANDAAQYGRRATDAPQAMGLG
ncbi:MAG: hypothetical protein ABF271_15365 [Abyssibacter sp.]|uniref:hypothetical protein n=1 Tax=Abyssibacter sp. TaxID=2320200 RepID=UPI002E9FD20A|nr:hypothetical protein [Pseudomonadota bacterium]